jgi:hypothetical protein
LVKILPRAQFFPSLAHEFFENCFVTNYKSFRPMANKIAPDSFHESNFSRPRQCDSGKTWNTLQGSGGQAGC